MKIKLLLSYDGTDYSGWQRQINALSIQQVLEEKIFSLTGERAVVIASGRTDAGVHAEGQVCHFELKNYKIPPENYAYCLNNILPPAIKVLESCAVDKTFHARQGAVKKTYVYRTYLGKTPLPLKDRYAYYIKHDIDLDKVRRAAKDFIGEYDFAAFSNTGSIVKSTVRRIFDIKIIGGENSFEIEITGSGFLYNMVRLMAGTLIMIGLGKLEENSVKNALKTLDKKYVGPTLAARGLSLKEVVY